MDSSTELLFRSTEELLKFLGQRFDLAMGSTGKTRASDSGQAPIGKKNARKGRIFMNMIRTLLFRGFLLVTLIGSYVYLTFGREATPVVPIVRNVAWNDFITQIKFLPDDSPQDSLDKEMLIIQKFLKAHQTEVRVGVYDLEVFRAID